jgi:cytochrome P450
VVHHLETYWPNPSAFDPLRFTPEGVASRPKCAYFPFGTGPHICIANVFALQQARLSIAMIVKNFDVTLLNPEKEVPMKVLISVKPSQAVNVVLKPVKEFS